MLNNRITYKNLRGYKYNNYLIINKIEKLIFVLSHYILKIH